MEWGATDCRTVTVIKGVEYGHLAGLLPPGYRPRDLSDMMGLPVRAQRAGLILAASVCGPQGDELQAGSLVATIEAPDIGHALEPTLYDVYEIFHFTVSTKNAIGMKERGWNVQLVNIDLPPPTVIGTTSAANANVTQGDVEVYRIFGTGEVQMPAGKGLVRFWHQSEGGTSYYEGIYPTGTQGGEGGCRIAGSHPLAQAWGSTGCALGGGEPFLYTIVREYDVAVRLVYLPGVYAR
jgi:hypothetical protein